VYYLCVTGDVAVLYDGLYAHRRELLAQLVARAPDGGAGAVVCSVPLVRRHGDRLVRRRREDRRLEPRALGVGGVVEEVAEADQLLGREGGLVVAERRFEVAVGGDLGGVGGRQAARADGGAEDRVLH